jgi:hypothetical protein
LGRKVTLTVRDGIVDEILRPLGHAGARSLLFPQPAVFVLEKLQMIGESLVAQRKRIDEQFTGPPVDFVREELRRRGRFFKRVKVGQRVQDALDESVVFLSKNGGWSAAEQAQREAE